MWGSCEVPPEVVQDQGRESGQRKRRGLEHPSNRVGSESEPFQGVGTEQGKTGFCAEEYRNA